MRYGDSDGHHRTSDSGRGPSGSSAIAPGDVGAVHGEAIAPGTPTGFVSGRGYGAPMTVIREEQAAEHIHGICLKTGPPRLVGVELEWLVRDVRDPALPVPAERIAAAVSAFGAEVKKEDSGAAVGSFPANGSRRNGFARQVLALPSSSAPGLLPSGATLTAEPGGQLELSSLPADSLADCVSSTAA